MVLVRLSALTIKNIDVKGNQVVEAADIENVADAQLAGSYLFLFPKKSILVYPHDAIQTALMKQFIRFSSVSVFRESPTSLGINVIERKPAALWCTDMASSTCYFMDGTGYVFAEAPDFSGDTYVVYTGVIDPSQALGSDYLSPDIFKQIQASIDSLNILGFKTAKVQADAEGTYTFSSANGLSIIMNDRQPFSTSLDTLQTILQSHPLAYFSSIDLRFGNKVFYRTENATSTTSTSTPKKLKP
ncbi:MAG: FtsQ-type POTRA domain-containing protein [Candidatus Pacebacteria bacterium]|nr:FtsQ-type POTRA domain-containing protein [Candidatus Paceibacterota bacterium]